ncbi:MAG: M20 family metallopeptidase [Nanobdellota archaeon]
MDSLDIAKALLSIDSVSGNETECLKYIESMLTEHEIEFQRIPVTKETWCILATKGTGKGLLMAGHIDTVPSETHYQAYTSEHHLHGLGASDMKAGVAIMLKTLIEYKGEPSLGLLVTVEEETTFNGAKACLKKPGQFAPFDRCILSEPTDLKVFASQFGIASFDYKATANQRHTATFSQGNHPVHDIMALLNPMISEFNQQFPESIISTNRFNAGNKGNIIPGEAHAHVDVRISPQDSLAPVERFIRQRIPAPQFTHRIEPVPIIETPFLKQAINLLGAPQTIAGFTEMYFYNQLGMQTIIFGPGILDMAHKVGETCPLGNIRDYERLLHKFL